MGSSQSPTESSSAAQSVAMRWRLGLLLLVLMIVVGRWAALPGSAPGPASPPVWPGAGVGLALLLLIGRHAWPVVALGAALGLPAAAGRPWTFVPAAMLALTSTAWLGAWLAERHAGGAAAFERTRDLLRFAIVAVLLAPLPGAALLALARGAPDAVGLAHRALEAWGALSTGVLLVAPVPLLWAGQRRLDWNGRQLGEALLLVSLLLLVCLLLFSGRMATSQARTPLGFAVVPLLGWAALRFCPRDVAVLSFVLGAAAVAGSRAGHGPFAWDGAAGPAAGAPLLLQAFLASVALTALLLAVAIHERQRLARRLARSEAQYRIVTDTASDAIIAIDRHSAIVYANAAVERLFGYTPAELLGQDLTLLMPPALRERHHAGLARYLVEGRRHIPWDGIALHGQHRDGRQLPIEISFGEYASDGEHQFIGVIRDLAARHRAAEQQSWLAAIIDSSEEAIVSKTLDGRITSWNAAAERLFGYPAAAAIGQPIALIVPDDRRSEEEQILERLRRGERIDHFETLRRHRDGHLLEVALTVSPVFDGSGQVVGASKIVHDISDRRRLAQLQQRALELEAENRAVLEIAQGRSAFLSRMSHELRTPLNGVLGFAQLLLTGGPNADPARLRGYLQSIVDSGRQLLGLIDRLLDQAALEANRLEFHPRPTDLRPLAAELFALVEAAAMARHVALSTGIDASIGPVRVDPVRLEQILHSLLSRAIGAAPPGGQVELRARRVGEHRLRIEVEHSGPARGDGRSSADLCLNPEQVQQLAEAQGGEVGSADTAGGGRIHHVELPLGTP